MFDLDMDMARSVAFWFSMAGLTIVLFLGLVVVILVMRSKSKDGKVNVVREFFSEDAKQGPGKGSFSRLAGAVGAMAIAATFVGIGYWAIEALFFEPENLDSLEKLRVYFLVGSALFAPYAFNKLSEVFRNR